jgi:hypothetical protein
MLRVVNIPKKEQTMESNNRITLDVIDYCINMPKSILLPIKSIIYDNDKYASILAVEASGKIYLGFLPNDYPKTVTVYFIVDTEEKQPLKHEVINPQLREAEVTNTYATSGEKFLTISEILEKYGDMLTEEQKIELRKSVVVDKQQNIEYVQSPNLVEQIAHENGYIKLGEDEVVVKKHDWERLVIASASINKVCEILGTDTKDEEVPLMVKNRLEGAVVLQPNQSVITWVKPQIVLADKTFHIVNEDWMFEIPTPPLPKKREVVVRIYEQRDGTLTSIIDNEMEVIPAIWKLVHKTETITL